MPSYYLQVILQVWGVLQRPLAQGAPRLVGRLTWGSGQCSKGKKWRIKFYGNPKQGEGSQGGSDWWRCDWAAWEQCWRTQLRQLRVRGRWSKHPLLCSGSHFALDMLTLLQFSWDGSYKLFFFRCKRCETRITTPVVGWFAFCIFSAWFLSTRQVLGEKEMVGPGRWNNGRLSVWTGTLTFNFLWNFQWNMR